MRTEEAAAGNRSAGKDDSTVTFRKPSRTIKVEPIRRPAERERDVPARTGTEDQKATAPQQSPQPPGQQRPSPAPR
jgi:hypothetical protein